MRTHVLLGQGLLRVNYKKILIWLVCLVLLIGVAIGTLALTRPLPLLNPTDSVLATPAATPDTLPWPTYGKAAIGTQNWGLLATHGTQTSTPIASTAKVITALSVL